VRGPELAHSFARWLGLEEKTADRPMSSRRGVVTTRGLREVVRPSTVVRPMRHEEAASASTSSVQANHRATFVEAVAHHVEGRQRGGGKVLRRQRLRTARELRWLATTGDEP
jgi:hypothetical protein